MKAIQIKSAMIQTTTMCVTVDAIPFLSGLQSPNQF